MQLSDYSTPSLEGYRKYGVLSVYFLTRIDATTAAPCGVVAVIAAFPLETPVTTPSETVATSGESELHTIELSSSNAGVTVTDNDSVSPAFRLTVP